MFAYILYEEFKSKNLNVSIVEVNRGYHYFVYVNGYSIDISGIFKGLKSPLKIKIGKEHLRILKEDEIIKRIEKHTKVNLLEKVGELYKNFN